MVLWVKKAHQFGLNQAVSGGKACAVLLTGFLFGLVGCGDRGQVESQVTAQFADDATELRPATKRTYMWLDQYPTGRVSGIALPDASFNVCWYFADVDGTQPFANDNLQQIFLEKAQPAHPNFISVERLRAVLDRRGLSNLKSKLFKYVVGTHDRESWKMTFGNIHNFNHGLDRWKSSEMDAFRELLRGLTPQERIGDVVSSVSERDGNRNLTECATTREGKSRLLAGRTVDEGH